MCFTFLYLLFYTFSMSTVRPFMSVKIKSHLSAENPKSHNAAHTMFVMFVGHHTKIHNLRFLKSFKWQCLKFKKHLCNKSTWRLEARENLLANPNSQPCLCVSCGRTEAMCSKKWRGLVCWVRDGGDWYETAVRQCSSREKCLTLCSRQTPGSLFMFLLRYLGTGEYPQSFHSHMTYSLV